MNAARGEVSAVLAGRPRTLCLTLGALAAIQATLGFEHLRELPARLGRMSEASFRSVLVALLEGGGEAVFARKLASSDMAWDQVDADDAIDAVADAVCAGLSAG